jgi:hypothetical protein
MQLDTVRDFAVELISALSKDQMFRVRKATALTIGSIAKLTGPEVATESLVSELSHHLIFLMMMIIMVMMTY